MIVRRIPNPKGAHYPSTPVVECPCGLQVECRGFTNTCANGRHDYNHAGQGLAPRSCWGEETGETANDILAAEAAGFPEEDA